ncbi:uncharacterized protein LOC100576387 [Apis mellifera]|uniref:Uncharacterized protein LOC100576387 n=1 Tax=Apis mellifera TaxID=7460 RepID=A0A7M7MPH9_APIME|nr:uncharacterized protein LOC100576387 [Apis mellifera]|eukprot:XP_026299068.1 uncharacterized protein LOC100576387 [Apis mellifera]
MIYYINFITFNYILLIIVKMQNDYNLCKFSKYKSTAGETMGNWGFSNRISNSGQELKRLRCLFNKMDSMRTTKPMMCVKYNYLYDPEAWGTKPSPEECKPIWMTFPMRRPLITYSSTATILLTSNLNEIGTDLIYPIPGRSYVLQGTDKWYRCR